MLRLCLWLCAVAVRCGCVLWMRLCGRVFVVALAVMRWRLFESGCSARRVCTLSVSRARGSTVRALRVRGLEACFTTRKAPVTRSDALVPSSLLFLLASCYY